MIPMTSEQQFSQADLRAFRVFTDQHGRQWGAAIENKTQHPCSDLIPKFKAPMYPPPSHIKIVDTYAATIRMDYDGWEAELVQAHADYEATRIQIARNHFGSQADHAIKSGDPTLLSLLGPPPKPIEPVQAMKQGNKWMLGLSQKPDPRLTAFFEKEIEPQPDFSDPVEYADEPETKLVPVIPLSRFPIHTGGGLYLFSDGSETKMPSKDEAVAYEAMLQEA